MKTNIYATTTTIARLGHSTQRHTNPSPVDIWFGGENLDVAVPNVYYFSKLLHTAQPAAHKANADELMLLCCVY